MRSMSQEETLKAKRQFERELEKHNIKVNLCRADNGRFAEKVFRDEMQNCHQLITFCGAGDHHQNGSIGQYIGKLRRGLELCFCIPKDVALKP